MRYEVRWSNGYWKLFDTFSYQSVDTFGLKTHAQDVCDNANLDHMNNSRKQK